jgi:tRNA-splicing ligase RtcB
MANEKSWRAILRPLDPYRWEVPVDYKPGMRVPVRIYADEELLDIAGEEHAVEQAVNVAMLPGIVWRSLAMPDIHWGYGFPIGGVAAMRLDDGVISPGGVGFDINCGTRLIVTKLTLDDVRPVQKQLVDQLFRDIPAGLGGQSELEVTDAGVDDRARLWLARRCRAN